MTTARNQYAPGVCNMGKAETRRRRTRGLVALGVTVVALVLFLVLPIPVPWRLLVFIPAAGAAAGLLQARLHFCAGFALRGVFNLGDDAHKTDTVEQAGYRRADQRKAVLIIVLSVVMGAAVAVLSLLL
ncbi:MAG: hypothetical protein ACYCZY_04605 [Lacisediminihabitans sp.]